MRPWKEYMHSRGKTIRAHLALITKKCYAGKQGDFVYIPLIPINEHREGMWTTDFDSDQYWVPSNDKSATCKHSNEPAIDARNNNDLIQKRNFIWIDPSKLALFGEKNEDINLYKEFY